MVDASNSSAARRVVVLLTSSGMPVSVFATDRRVFPELATHDRDRIFRRTFQGDLAGLAELPQGVHGAIYVEADAWRIRQRGAQILPFQRLERAG